MSNPPMLPDLAIGLVCLVMAGGAFLLRHRARGAGLRVATLTAGAAMACMGVLHLAMLFAPVALVTVLKAMTGLALMTMSVLAWRILRPLVADDGAPPAQIPPVPVPPTEASLVERRIAAMAIQLADSKRRFEMALGGSSITVFEQDENLRYTYMHNPPAGTTAADFIGRSDHEMFTRAELAPLMALKQGVLDSRQPGQGSVQVMIGGRRRYFDIYLEPQRTGARGVIGTAVDLTEHRENEAHLHLLMRELTHRSKNLLAVVQAMARQTAQRAGTMDLFITSFTARLRAMAASHDLLVSRSWRGAGLRDLLLAQLAQITAPDDGRLTVAGPAVAVNADVAQNLGMAFHELATNASKYGALSTDEGRVSVHWSLEDGALSIRWRERDGPPVTEPRRRGFGQLLLERTVGASMGGSVSLSFEPAGLECDIVVPAGSLLKS